MPTPSPTGPGHTGKDFPDLFIRTPRLDLIAVTAAMAAAEIHDRAGLAELLHAEIPRNWPPVMRLDSLTCTWELLRQDQALCGWLDWYLVLKSPPAAGPILIGSVGFQGRPDPEGALTIDYALATQFEGRGYAVEAVAGLIAWAFTHENVKIIRAETYPVLTASISLLEKLGFRLLGCGRDRLAMGYELERRDYLSRLADCSGL